MTLSLKRKQARYAISIYATCPVFTVPMYTVLLHPWSADHLTSIIGVSQRAVSLLPSRLVLQPRWQTATPDGQRRGNAVSCSWLRYLQAARLSVNHDPRLSCKGGAGLMPGRRHWRRPGIEPAPRPLLLNSTSYNRPEPVSRLNIVTG